MANLNEADRVEAAGRGLVRLSVWIYLLSVALSAPLLDFYATFSVALGGAIALFNLAFLERFLSMILSDTANPGAARVMASFSFYARFGLIAAGLSFFMIAGWVNAPALLAGLSVGVIAIFFRFITVIRLLRKESYERAY